MSVFLTLVGVPVLLLGLGYLAACAGAERWLTPREWWGS